MMQTLLEQDADQETISLEEIQRKIIAEQALKLWLHYGENSIPLERDGTTHIITMQNKSHKATTRSGQKLDLTEQEMDYLRQYAYQRTLEEYAADKTIVQPAGQEETVQELEEEISQKDRTIQQQAQTIERMQTCQDKIHEITANHDMTYSDRVLWTIVLLNHTEEILNLKPFQPNISRLRQESGVGTDTATKFFASMHEARGIQYSNKPQQESGNWSSVSTIVPLAEHTQVNTKAATKRIKQREEVTKRRLARKLITVPCENCGSSNEADAYAAIVPFCQKCQHASMTQQERVPAKNVRIVEEETIPPTHEFSEVTDHEYLEEDETTAPSHEFSAPTSNSAGNNLEETENNTDNPGHEFSETQASPPAENATTGDTSHEFSDLPRSDQVEQIQTSTPSHEFSEGMRVETPIGIGIISFIGEVKGIKRYRVQLSTRQQDGTYYAAFYANEIRPIVQTSLL